MRRCTTPATAVAAARDAGTLVFAAELVERNGAVRQLKLTYHLHAEHDARLRLIGADELRQHGASSARRARWRAPQQSAPVPFWRGRACCATAPPPGEPRSAGAAHLPR